VIETVTVDPEFAALIPPISTDEYRQLEANILADGCRDALVTWPVNGSRILLDGHNRLRICQEHGVEFRTVEEALADRDSATIWIIRHQLGRRNLPSYDRGVLELRLEPLLSAQAKERQGTRTDLGHNIVATLPQCEAGKTRDALAKGAGLSGRTIDKIKVIQAKAPEAVKEQIRSGETSISAVYKDIRKQERDEEEKAAAVVAQEIFTEAKRQSFQSVCDIRVCSCAELFASGIKPDAVITDPPYPREFLPVFSELAKACKGAGVPLVAVMSGQTYLPEVMQRLCEHLTYRWALAYLTPGGQSVQQFPAKVNTFWKPVLLFGESIEWLGDVCRSDVNDNDKRYHEWGQSESGMADLVERLTKPNQLVCDPFGGGFVTAVVSLALGRRFVGCDIDAGTVEAAMRRCEAAIA
jgi:site-specific DNA-methyltransferase (adenine-specific)